MTDFEHTYYSQKGKLLCHSHCNDGEFYFASDTRENYQNNLKKQPKHWHYRNKKIYYKHNSQGYRTKEFDEIDWSKSIVVFGCSIVYGVGLAEDETVCYHLEQITGKPVVNLGAPGSSIAFSTYNQVALHEINPEPLAVVNVWTAPERTTYFEKNQAIDVGPWNSLEHRFQKMFTIWALCDSNPMGHAWMHRRTCQQLWQKTLQFECTFFPRLHFDVLKLEAVDQARDLMHPGNKSMYQAAKKIAQGLEL